MRPRRERKPDDFYFSQLPGDDQPVENLFMVLLNEAIRKDFWLFNTEIKRWYTPDEFRQLNERIDRASQNRLLEKYKVMDPLEGLDAAHRQLESLRTRLEVFEKKVVEYYRSKR